DGIAHGITNDRGEELRGPKAFREFHRRFLGAFPDLKIEIADTVVAGDKVTARCIVRGKHTGNSLGIPASQKDVEFTGMWILKVRNGMIAEAWNNFDFLTLYSQLGALEQLGRGQRS